MKRNFINFYPSRWSEFFYRSISDYRICRIETVDLIGTKVKSVVTVVTFVGTQRAVYVLGRRVWSRIK